MSHPPDFQGFFLGRLADGRTILGITPAALEEMRQAPIELPDLKLVLLYGDDMAAILRTLAAEGVQHVPTPHEGGV